MGSEEDAEAWFQKGYKQITRLRGEDLSEFKSDNKDALAAFDKAISLKPDHAEAWFWKGSALSVLDRHEEALGAYEQVLRLRPGDLSAREREVEVLGKLGRHAEASFEQGIWWVILSASADSVSDLRSEQENALAAFDEATNLKPDYAKAWFWKGLVLDRMGRDDKALSAFEEVLRYQPEDPDAWLQKAALLTTLGKHEEALAAYEEVLRLRPDDLDALFRKAETLGKLERYDEVVAACGTLLRSRPDNESRVVEVRFLLGNALASLGRHGEAKAAYREAMSFRRADVDWPAPPSEALRCFEAAREAYSEMLRLVPAAPAVWERAGNAFCYAGLPNEALQAYETAARLTPDTEKRYVWRRAGDGFHSAGHAIEALQAYEALIRLVPDDYYAWYGKAEALVQAGRREEAIPAYQQSLRFWPGFLAAEARLKVILQELGRDKDPAPEG